MIIERVIALLALSASLRIKSNIFVVVDCTHTLFSIDSFVHGAVVIYIILSLPSTLVQLLYQSLFISVLSCLSWDYLRYRP